jgi:DnaK suppressor protein
MGTELPLDTAGMQRRLLARQQELERLIETGVEDSRPAALDQQRVGRLSRMDAMQVQAMAEETVRRRKLGLARVHAALRRIADGEYGYCTSCDEPIGAKRLENDPATPLCIGCASRAG